MATQPNLPGFSYNLGHRERAGYGLYDPKGAANLRSVLPVQANYLNNYPAPAPGSAVDQVIRNSNFQNSNSMQRVLGPAPAGRLRLPGYVPAGYVPGQYMFTPSGLAVGQAIYPSAPPPVAAPPAAAPAPTGGNSALAVRPNAAPATIPSAAPAMKAADVLNVRTIPGTGGQPALPPAAGGVGSRFMGAAGMVGKALPFVGDVLQGAAYGMDPNSNASTMDRIGRGLAAGVGSFGGRVAGALAGPVTSVAGSIGGAAGGAALYDQVTAEPSENERKALEGFGMSGQGGGSFATPANRYSPNSGAPAVELQDEAREILKPTAETEAFFDAVEFEKRRDMRTGDSPDARAARSQETPAQRNERAEVARRETKANYPSLSPEKAASPKGEFKGPSEEEMARFRKQTGTPYDPKSITDKLNLERMRAGEQTFTSKQSREFRKSNPTYRPGQYVKRG